MSQFIPRSAVIREVNNQVTRRLYIEKRNEAAIKGFQEMLKTQKDVVDGLMALGLTKNHALGLQERLRMYNEIEKRAEEARDLKKKAAAVKPEETLVISAEDALAVLQGTNPIDGVNTENPTDGVNNG
jgi:hypothetical protein